MTRLCKELKNVHTLLSEQNRTFFTYIFSKDQIYIYANTQCGVKSSKGDAGHQLCPQFPPGYKVKAWRGALTGSTAGLRNSAKGRAAVRETWA